MADVIEIRNPDVVRDIHRLAERTGKPADEAVAEAVRAKLGAPERGAETDITARRKRVDEVLARIDRLPHSGEPLTDDDLYDEDGFPR